MENTKAVENIAGKRLLVLGGASVHCKVVEAAKRLGVYTIVTDYLEDSPAKQMADETLMLSILDVDAIVRWCQENPVDGVINYCNDPAQKAHQQICQRLGLPCYGDEKQVEALTDKRIFKQVCQQNGVSVVPTFSEKDVMREDLQGQFPVLIKPCDSRGSRGQTICYTKEEVAEGVEKAKQESFSGKVTIERYMGAHDDLQLVYLVVNGEPALVKVEDRFLGSKEHGLDRLCIATVCPSQHEAQYRKMVDHKVTAMIRQLGIQNGPVFLQGFWDDNDVLFYDPGIRLPGDEFDYAYTAATGICIPELLVRYALTGHFPECTAARIQQARIKQATAMVIPCVRPGKIGLMSGLEEIRAWEDTAAVTVYYHEGDVVEDNGNCKQRIAEFVLCCPSFQVLQERISQLCKILCVRDDMGEDMLIELLQPSALDTYR